MMNSLPSLLRSKTSLAIALYLSVFGSLFWLVNAQVASMRLLQTGQSVLLR
ncbi:MAG TPA: hypothetical protein V6D19_04605 [Stenomitos sp.]